MPALWWSRREHYREIRARNAEQARRAEQKRKDSWDRMKAASDRRVGRAA